MQRIRRGARDRPAPQQPRTRPARPTARPAARTRRSGRWAGPCRSASAAPAGCARRARGRTCARSKADWTRPGGERGRRAV